MREIKFRVPRIIPGVDNQKGFATWEIITLPNDIRDDEIYLGNTYYVYSYFQQYTGLKDKNGTEIYEGDVVEWDVNDGKNRMLARIEKDNLGGRYQTIPYINPTTEVVGNIYENPELLDNK